MVHPHFLYHHYKRWLPWLIGFIRLMAKQYNAKSCQKSADSLTYMTLFATVPLLTVIYSVFSLIPIFQDLGDELQAVLFDNFLPHTEQELVQHLRSFAEQARQMTVFGLAFLALSAYLMLRDIEQNFNSIWGVTRGRRGIENFLLYSAILTVGPILLGLALAISTYLVSFRLLVGAYDSLGILEWVFKLIPWLLTWGALSLLFIAVPNCTVPFWPAVIGGLVATICFHVLKAIFAWIVSHSSFSLIYGAFAALPLFLIWVNLTWTVILGGAVFVYTVKSYQIGLRDRGYPDLYASLLLLWQLYLAAAKGEARSEHALLHEGLSTDQWQRIREYLLANNVIGATDEGDFILTYDLKSLRLYQLKAMLKLPDQLPAETVGLEQLPWGNAAIKHLRGVDSYVRQALSVTVDDIFNSRESLID